MLLRTAEQMLTNPETCSRLGSSQSSGGHKSHIQVEFPLRAALTGWGAGSGHPWLTVASLPSLPISSQGLLAVCAGPHLGCDGFPLASSADCRAGAAVSPPLVIVPSGTTGECSDGHLAHKSSVQHTFLRLWRCVLARG